MLLDNNDISELLAWLERAKKLYVSRNTVPSYWSGDLADFTAWVDQRIASIEVRRRHLKVAKIDA